MKKVFLRITGLLVCLSLCLCLAACAPKDQRAFERACALMEAGEYEAAIEAFEAIGMYREISGKVEEARELLDEENCEFLYGDWVNTVTGSVFTFSKGGKGNIAADEMDTAFAYTCDGKNVDITDPTPLRLKVDKVDGVVHLKDQDGRYDLVPAKDYVAEGPIVIEITRDNWRDFFVGRQAQDVGVDSDGFVNHRELGYGFFLKEEYCSGLDLSAGDPDVWFDFEYEYEAYLLEGNLQSDFYKLTEVRMTKDQDIFRGEFTASLPVLYRGYQQWRSPESDFNNAFCAFIGVESMEIDGQTYIMMIDDVEVTDVHGTIVLMP